MTLLITHGPDTSFPSDHATLAFAITVGLWPLDRRLGWILLLLSAWLCVARVYVGAHYPSDVLGGAVLGAATGFAMLWLSRRRGVQLLLDRLFDILRRFHLAKPGGVVS